MSVAALMESPAQP